MQKDFHYYLTAALAVRAGFDKSESALIAWSDQYTDECTQAPVNGVQTAVKVSLLGTDGWRSEHIQTTVLSAFHFLPGDDPDKPRMTTQGCTVAQNLLLAAEDIFGFGIALHSFQDTYSHQGFSGFYEDVNRCWPVTNWQAILPQVGHTELGLAPDIIDQVWTDPRNNKIINNRRRALDCAEATFAALCRFRESEQKDISYLRPLLSLPYEQRKTELMKLAGVKRFKELNYHSRYCSDFNRAAKEQLALVL
jgi:hypothetical protein